MNIRSRGFLLFAGLMSIMLVAAAACSSGTSSGDKTKTAAGGGKTPAAGTTTTASGGDQAPADQQKITVQFAEPEFYDPQKSNFEQDIGVERMLFRGLYNLTDDGNGGVKVVPGMAAGEPTISGSVYTVKLKTGQKWSDGKDLTAADFVYGITRACDPDVASPYQYLLGAGLGELKGCDDLTKNTDAAQAAALKAALGVKAVNASTLEFTLNKPVATFTTIFSLWATFPARQDVIEAKGAAWTEPANIVTNGPFTMKELVLKDHVTLVPNPNWAGQKPALQEITIKFIDDFSAALRAYQTGELDMTRINASDVKVAESDSALRDEIVIDPTARITSIEMQMEDPTLKDFNVRLALSRAIDRDALVDVVYDRVHAPATYWVVKGLKGFQGNEAFDSIIGYDAAAAKKALADAGFPGGAGFPELKITYRDSPERRNEADFLVKAWKDTLGITVVPEFVDSKTRSATFNAETFQLFQGGWQLDYPDIENPLVGLFDTGGGNNHYNCSDPEIDAAFAAAASATSEAARIKAYQDVETRLIETLCGVAPIFQDSLSFLVDSKIGGIVPNGTIDAGMPGNYCVECWFVKKA